MENIFLINLVVIIVKLLVLIFLLELFQMYVKNFVYRSQKYQHSLSLNIDNFIKLLNEIK